MVTGARSGIPILVAGLALGAGHQALGQADTRPAPADFFVAPDGNDANQGTLTRPFASLPRARDAVRERRAAQPNHPITVLFRGGVYPITETVVFTPADSGTATAPIRYAAYPGEEPVLWGGRRIQGWRKEGNGIYSVELPEVRAGTWDFRQLFADNQRLTRARTPNVDPVEPLRKGFFHAASGSGGFGTRVVCIHNSGDWMKYEVDVVADGEYVFWMLYGAQNANTEWKTAGMGGRTTLTVDGRAPVPLDDLPDSGSWKKRRWGRCAVIRLGKGKHTLVWTNVKGGGLDIDAYVLCDDPDWQPVGTELEAPTAGKHMFVIQAESFTASQGKQLRVAVGGGVPTRFRYKLGELRPEWADVPGAEVHIHPSGYCRAIKEILSIASVDTDKRVVHVSGPEAKAELCPGDRYFVENVPDALDSPGEWYLDRAAGKLLFMPPDPIDELEVVAPVACDLVRFDGDVKAGKAVENITFSGFTVRFTGMTLNDGCDGWGLGKKGVFHWEGARNCTIERCRFENCGRSALASHSGSRNRFVRCTVRDSAQGGVLLIDSDHCEVTDCTMDGLGAIYKHIGGVVLTGGKTSDCLVAHNLIRNSARYGISFKIAGFRNVVEFNSIHRMCTETYDTGGIEVTQHNRTERSNSVIRNNLVEDVIGYSSTFDKPCYLSWGIYLDSFAGGYTVENNVTVRSSHGVMIQGGKGNTLRNNIFVDASLVQFTFPNFSGNCEDNEFTRNIVYWTDPKARFGSMGRELEKTLKADHNLFFCAGKPLTNDSGWTKWRKLGFGEHDRNADPLFRDPAADDYTLKPGSPAFELGFQPIDLSTIGPRD
ncbi:MAG: hypothetical protein HN742_10450 [Lentisphaerae bacterium]|jgi:parallel beta-helix repeat protein|nr:hypothetical protein [Lentisphaerota bacterium]MBT4821733.1 hypothetical protein [Lentisphaerota bacterium]MBT5607709.1 hypothetical protein [Lentisphaerota bacterium]MBT7062318.1 hypothetical protein [Lentisphaerota bacterium]MBT7842284.1 hypothetical protein [Lentisphaerota bacterium]